MYSRIYNKVRNILDKHSCFSTTAFNNSLVTRIPNAQRQLHNTSSNRSTGGVRVDSTGGKPVSRHYIAYQDHHGRNLNDCGKYSWKSSTSLSQYRGNVGTSFNQTRHVLACSESISTFIKQVTSFLNKMSSSNFDKLSKNIINLVINGTSEPSTKDERMSEVFKLVISKCYGEHSYIPLYSRLIYDMVNARVVLDGDIITSKVHTLLDAFVSESISGFLADDFYIPDVDDYDAFCASNKLSHCAMGRHLSIINLISKRLVTINRETYFDTIISMFKNSVPDKRAELALEFVIKYIEHFENLIVIERELVEELFDRFYRVEVGDIKIRFKVMTIYDIVYGKQKLTGH